eukprot:PhF_6_TR37508/c0_g1_i6/m.55406
MKKRKEFSDSNEMKPNANSNLNQILLFVSVLIGAGLLLFGYDAGSRRQANEDTIAAQGLKRRGDALFKKIRECNIAVSDAKAARGDNQADADQLSTEYKRLQRENEDHYAKNEDQEKKYSECQEQAEAQKSLWTEEDAENAKRLTKLHGEVKTLNLFSKQLSKTHGMRYQLAYHNILRLKAENRQLRKQLGLPDTDDSTDEYAQSLLQKWKPQLDKYLRSSALLPSESYTMNQTIKTLSNEKFLYTPERYPNIFVPLTTLAKPEWKGRVGSPTPTRGTFINRRYTPKSRLSILFQSMFTVALCAYDNEIMNFTYPNAFRRMEPSLFYRQYQYRRGRAGENANYYNKQRGGIPLNVSLLSDYIETPLITFCTDCLPMIATKDFRLLCGVQANVYGTYSFWAMRSRMRFKPQYYDRADLFATELKIANKPYLSVIWRQVQQSSCEVIRRYKMAPRRMFSWLMKNYDNTTFPSTAVLVTNDTYLCDPPVTEIIRVISERLASNLGLAAVYLAASDDAISPEE